VKTGTKQVNLSRLGATPEQDRLEGVTVVWVSKSPAHGPVIVGWYRNATLFREYQEPLDASGREYDGTTIGFYATAAAEDCILLPEEGGVNSADKLYLVIKSVRPETKHSMVFQCACSC
jgi:hypothetical protein